MGKSIVTGSEKLPAGFKPPLTGMLSLNGVEISLWSSSPEEAVKKINRFTAQTAVTASVAGSSGSKNLVLTSPEDMRVYGHSTLLRALGLHEGLTTVSTDASTSYVAPAAHVTSPSTWAPVFPAAPIVTTTSSV